MKTIKIFFISILLPFISAAQTGGGFPSWPIATSNGTAIVNMQSGIIANIHNNSPSESAAIPGYGCGALKFYCKHSGSFATKQLEIFDANGIKLLGNNVPTNGANGLDASIADGEIQVVPVPNTPNEWYIIYNQTPSSYFMPYEPTVVLVSRIRFNCGSGSNVNLQVISKDEPILIDPKNPKSAATYRAGKAVTKLLNGNHHFMYLFQRNHNPALSSDFEIGSSFTIDRYDINATGVFFKDRSTPVIDNNWIMETTAIELKPNDETQVGVLVRKQGLTGVACGCTNVSNTNLSFKPYLYLFKTNQDQTIPGIPTLVQTIDFTTLKITGLGLSMQEFCGTSNCGTLTFSQTSTTPAVDYRYLQNFWRKIANFEYSPNGKYIYFVSGGFVSGSIENLSYLGQIQVNLESGTHGELDMADWITLQCQKVTSWNQETGAGLSTNNNTTDQIISNLESAPDGNLYFVKTNSDKLFVVPHPNSDLSGNFLPHDVDLSITGSYPNITLNNSGHVAGSCFYLPDQIDGYLHYLNGTVPTLGANPGGTIETGVPVTITSTSTGSWSVVPAGTATLNPSGSTCTFTASHAGQYTISFLDVNGCCTSIQIQVIEHVIPAVCCDLPGLTINGPTRPYVQDHHDYYGLNFGLTIMTSPILYQEVRASLINFELSYPNPDCSKCYNNYSYMGTFLLQNSPSHLGSLQQQSLGHYSMGSVIPGSSPILNGVREIVWNGQPSQLGAPTPTTPGMVTPTFEILFPKPILPNCCDMKVKACIKIVFKDANCNICEKYLCLEFNKDGLASTSEGRTKAGSINNYGVNDDEIK
jgi:hypothetical protein